MQVKKSTLQNLGIVFSILLFGLVIIFIISNKPAENINAGNTVSIEGSTQIISMTAKVGFTPNRLTAKANQSTILRVATNNTFDCSSSIRIPSLNISKTLPASGNTDIALGSQAPGTIINGTCGMGMYSFQIQFPL